MAALQVKLQTASQEFQKLQADYSSTVEARQKLDAQLSENELVKKVRWNLASTRSGVIYIRIFASRNSLS